MNSTEELDKLNLHHNAVAAVADKMPEGLPYGLREALAELKVHDLGSLRRVPESTFVRDILPALTGEMGTLVDFKWWGFRFGSPFRGFFIVKDDDHNQVVFEVPALLDSNFKPKPASSPRDTVREAAMNYQNRAYNRPGQAKREFTEALQQRIDFTETGQALKHMQMLDKIFIHYGKPSIFEQTQDTLIHEVVGKSKPAATSATPEAQVYDETEYSDEGMFD